MSHEKPIGVQMFMDIKFLKNKSKYGTEMGNSGREDNDSE